MNWRRILSTQAVLLVVALLLLWLALRTVSLPEVINIFRQFHFRDLGAIVLLDFCVLLVISARWWFVLDGFGYALPFLRLIRYRTAVFGLGYITPGPQLGGEVLQVYFPASRHKVPVAVALAAASVDKTLEMLGNFTFMVGGAFIVLIGQHLITDVNTSLVIALSSLLLLPLGLIIAIWRGKHPISGFVLWLERLAPVELRRRIRANRVLMHLPSLHRLHTTIHHSEDLTAWLCRTRPTMILLAIFMTFVAWCLIYSEFWVVAHALNLPLTRAEAVATLVLVYFAFLLPMPGGLGAMEAALVLALTSFGYAPAQAISLGLMLRGRDLTQAAIGLILGGIEGWRQHESVVEQEPRALPQATVTRQHRD